MQLSSLHFNLPEWKEVDFQLLKKSTSKIKKIGNGAATKSERFQQACLNLIKLCLAGEIDEIPSNIKSSIDVRAFTFLISSESGDFSKKVRITPQILSAILVPRSPMSKLSLIQLIRAYLTFYDQLAEKSDLTELRKFLQEQLGHIDTTRATSDLAVYARYSHVLYSDNGPAAVVSFTKSQHTDFDVAIRNMGLTGFANGRFLTLCRYIYYLETIKALAVGAEDPILAEIVKPDVVNAPYDDKRLLGHAILELLIDRAAGKPISKAWQTVILTIAGDPRVPTSNPNYQKWWILLGENRIALMRGWLSRFDLALFLKVLEQSARDGQIDDMERMFEPRKQFMEGLLEQGLVTNSRLFLSRHAEQYLKGSFRKEELPDYALVDSPETSMIYLNLAGKVHMIEGSHSFKLKLLDKFPSQIRITNYNTRKFSDYEFRSQIVRLFYRDFGSLSGMEELTHDIHLNWQHKAIQFLEKQGIKLSAFELIGKNRYREYKTKFGI